MARYSAIASAEEHGTLREEFQHGVGLTASVVLRCAWADRLPLMLELLSDIAYPYPNTPIGWTPPYPIGVTISPDETKYTTDADEQVITYIDALLTVQYGYIDVTFSNPDPDDPDDPDEKTIVTENLEPSTEFLTNDSKNFRWTDEDVDNLPEGVSPDNDKMVPVEEGDVPGKLLRSYNLVRQYFNVRKIHGSILTLPGLVNKERYTSKILGMTFEKETLLFKDPSMQRSFTTKGEKGWTLTLRFGFKNYGWNKFWRPDSATWASLIKVKESTTGGTNIVESTEVYKPYPLGDFSYWLR